jgi:hypothetical protein
VPVTAEFSEIDARALLAEVSRKMGLSLEGR